MNFGGQESTREGEKFRGTLNSIAYGEVMSAAAKNLQKVRASESTTRTSEADETATPALAHSAASDTLTFVRDPSFSFIVAALFETKQEMMDAEASARERNQAYIDMDDLLDDPDLQRIHEERIAALQKEAEKRAEMKQKGHGTYEEIEEGKFLEVVTKTDLVVVHFFHKEFERCKIVDKHLKILSTKYFDTKFVKISAPVSPAA